MLQSHVSLNGFKELSKLNRQFKTEMHALVPSSPGEHFPKLCTSNFTIYPTIHFLQQCLKCLLYANTVPDSRYRNLKNEDKKLE